MKKAQFYSLIREQNKITAKLQQGYTDGTYNYYSPSRSLWYAIHPETGTSICDDTSLKKVQILVYSDNIQNRLQSVQPDYIKLCREQFQKLIEEVTT